MKTMKLPWSERLPMLSIHPDAADYKDIARMADELLASNHAKLSYEQGLADERRACMRLLAHLIRSTIGYMKEEDALSEYHQAQIKTYKLCMWMLRTNNYHRFRPNRLATPAQMVSMLEISEERTSHENLLD